MRRLIALCALMVSLVLIGASCADSATDDDAASSDSTDADSGDESVAGGNAGSETTQETSGADDSETTADDPASTTSSTAGDDTELPGEAFDIGPPAGSTLDVVGVRYDDVLNFRTLPDAGAPIVDTVAPEATTPAIVSGGEGRLLTRSAWWKVTVGGEEAWANVAFLGVLGVTDDISESAIGALSDDRAPSAEALIEALAATRADGPEPTVTLVTPVQGLDTDGAEVIVDVIGLGDDAVKGERLLLTFDLIFVDPEAANLEIQSYNLIGVRSTVICGRGATDDGLCL